MNNEIWFKNIKTFSTRNVKVILILILISVAVFVLFVINQSDNRIITDVNVNAKLIIAEESLKNGDFDEVDNIIKDVYFFYLLKLKELDKKIDKINNNTALSYTQKQDMILECVMQQNDLSIKLTTLDSMLQDIEYIKNPVVH